MLHRSPVVPPARDAGAPVGTRARARTIRLLPAAALALLAACADDSPDLTGPSPSAAVAPPRTAQPRDPLSSRLSNVPGSCLVAVRTPDGRYLGRTASVPLPRGIAASAGRTTRFAYRGWAADVPEPVLLAVCTIPDTPAARAYFETRFSGRALTAAELRSFAHAVGVAGAGDWDPVARPHMLQGATPVHVTDGLASRSAAARAIPRQSVVRPGGAATDDVGAMLVEECDPTMIIPEPGCEGWTPEEETIPETPPAPDPDPSFSVLPVPGGSIQVVCEVRTDYPHRSTTAGFGGNINVKSHNICTAPMYHSVQSTLKRQKCVWWIFCSWPAIAQSIPYVNPSAMRATAPATANCAWKDGWYRGEGRHTTIYLGNTVHSRTATPGVRIRCW